MHIFFWLRNLLTLLTIKVINFSVYIQKIFLKLKLHFYYIIEQILDIHVLQSIAIQKFNSCSWKVKWILRVVGLLNIILFVVISILMLHLKKVRKWIGLSIVVTTKTSSIQ